MRPFTPLSRPKTSLIRELARRKKTRDAERAFLMEGVKPIRDLLHSQPSAILAIIGRTTFLEQTDPALQQILENAPVPVHVCTDRTFDTLSDLTNSPGILAVVRQPSWNQERILRRPGVLGLYGEGLQDPTNVGAIIRTAMAFELDALWLTTDSADIFNPKVVRSTAGALLQLPVFAIRDAAEFIPRHCAVLAAEPQGAASRPIHEIKSLPSRAVIAFGNEGRGLMDATRAQAFLRFHIPVSSRVDSLNVAASAAIAAFYFRDLPRDDAM